MKKRIVLVTFLLLFGMTLVSCSKEDKGQLTRVDVQKVIGEGNYEEVVIITNKDKIDMIGNAIENVKWSPNVEPKMTRYEDVLATLFYTFDKNMPERVYEYEIWFHQRNETAIIISSNEKEGFGTLDKESSKILKGVLLQ